jgi:hypothetical protein
MSAGVSLSGGQWNPEFTPWPTLGLMKDDEFAATFMYLSALPAQDSTSL